MLSAAVRDDIARRLAEAERRRRPVTPLSVDHPAIEVPDAYEIQLINIRRRTAAGARIVGYKVGLTSKVMQEMIGVDEPDFGHLLEEMRIEEDRPADASRFCAARVEAEIAFLLGADLPGGRCTVDDVLDATEFVAPSIEVIDTRIEDWRIGVCDTIADNASSAGFAIGAARVAPDAIDLVGIEASLLANGEKVAAGRSDAVMGHPARAVAWFADQMDGLGIHLKAGDIVLPGSCTKAIDIHAGDEFVADFTGLGGVRIAFG
ncbi:2-keto-4-pentenoate hydratase [Rhodococcus sp. D2-41]|uniref:2-keto-4-pentenoate hydratase n=1 Tax=Speluncibacter jeojiensis TaxID=2710754 RepID=A0A9X4REF9_9ACTN|nr:2-keto-4-pentenoate hydratase [Rhodococcus sp. D2-41]MDG3011457.1 2-keto-4-pentenoate hydratase [Rhodococcus sp. D2-41]MDG3015187.1 2-keto-4-pentenoate hydratase [Corynebacteriales bacterium D3-21]